MEPPGGEIGRRTPPFFHDDPDPEKSLCYLMLNLNKRGITLNLDTEEGAAILRRLASDVDVIVESFPPGYLADRGLDYASLEQENPGLVMTSITPFGQTGPYAHYKGDEITAYATSGMMAISGTADREPLKHGGFPGQYESGMNGFLGTLVALYTRDLTGAGQQVDLSIQDIIASSLVLNQPYYSFAGGIQGRRHAEGSNFGQVMPCKDGYFVAQPGGGVTWDGIADFFGKAEMKEHRFADVAERVRHGPELDEIILDATKDRTHGRDVQDGIGEIPHADRHRADSGRLGELRTPGGERLFRAGRTSGDRQDQGPIPPLEHVCQQIHLSSSRAVARTA